MMKKEFFSELSKVILQEKEIAEIEKIYKCSLPEEVKKLVSYAPKGAFVDGWRLLCTDEIIAADKELHLPFTKLQVIPLIDTYDNDFIVYLIKEKSYAKMNIADGIFFNKEKSVAAY